VTCACGERISISLRASGPPKSTPYRSSKPIVTNDIERAVPCPYCGNMCGALSRVCPHCDVRLETVRCARCYTLHPPGSFACGRCGEALELEPLLDATDAPCPRCSYALDVAPESERRNHECARCGGIFVPKEVLPEILVAAEVSGAVPELPRSSRRLDEVRYLPCPLCHASMNRVNFGKVSGVIVDVCKEHGTWFDAGELTAVVAFAASGGLDRTREREKKERESQRVESAQIHAGFVSMEARTAFETRLSVWKEFLAAILFW
jgi:Zn-finger nucleic acid-binding protein